MLYQQFQETNLLGFPVLDEHDKLWGIVSLQDLENTLAEPTLQLRNAKVEDLATVDPLTVYADEPIWAAIQKMAPRDLARLPVISRSTQGKLIGLISRSDILRAYDVAIVRKQRGQLLEEHIALRREQNNESNEFHLRNGQNAVGKHLQDLNLPLSVKVISLDREGSVHIPRGDTLFTSGDIISIDRKSVV